ncbi:MAG: uncharacterized protein KVP18_004359 [Porospora cf. gigantea A]|nr:MAG: hypothetical protein KVP18_004359 [Porospora cf. gigantea A]
MSQVCGDDHTASRIMSAGESETILINRDPSLFHRVLNHMQKGWTNLHPTSDPTMLMDLRDEAEFFGLCDLVDTITAHLGDRPSRPPSGLALINDEPEFPDVQPGVDLGDRSFEQSMDF